ncbi:hypothetical protein [Microbacterium halophytorum]|uniref:hypothetical protein n=1 Tax=Microbacterium halophytorum TaxID=2067568 RepID=UPI0018E0A701|nr:hypothetical protein [Microbacterium halophytorum]
MSAEETSELERPDDIDALKARLARLEARNRELEEAERPSKRDWGRSTVAVVLILVSVLLAPIAVLGTWARVQLVDTDRFVATFAPLAEDPQVQDFVADQAVQAIEENVDIDSLVGDLFTGLAELDLPPRAQDAIPLLAGPASEGVRSLISSGVDKVVASPQFAQLWENTLRETHGRAIAIIQGDPDTAIQLSDDGTVTLELNTLIEQVKEVLIDEGFGFAENIPAIDRSIPLVTADALVLVRTVYQIAVAAGYWLPWLVLGLVAAGVATAHRRARALGWAGIGLAASFLLLAAGLGAGRVFFVGAVSPSVMPAGTARSIFDQLTELLSSTLTALIVLSAFVALGAWLSGRSRPAAALRGATSSAFSAVRGAADRHGVRTGAFGRAVDRWRPAIIVLTILVGVFALFLTRPVTTGAVVTTVVLVLVVLLVIELVRRPAEMDAAAASGVAAPTPDAAAEGGASVPEAARSPQNEASPAPPKR